MKLRNLAWFLLGTLAGWFIIWLAAMFGAAALSALLAVFTVLYPVFAVVGLLFVLWWALFRRK